MYKRKETLFTKVIKNPDHPLFGWKVLGVGARELSFQKKRLEEHGINKVQFDFNTLYGWAPRDLEFLYNFPDAEAVRIGGNYLASAPLEGLRKLYSFRDIAAARPDFSFEPAYDAHDLSFDYEKSHPRYELFKEARFFSVDRLPKRFESFELLNFLQIRLLSIGSSPIQSFAGIERFGDLERLIINRCRKLENPEIIKPMPSVKSVRLHYLPNLGSLEFLSAFENLEHLELVACGDIDSLEPLRNLKKLRRIDGEKTRLPIKIGPELISSWPNIEFISGMYTETPIVR